MGATDPLGAGEVPTGTDAVAVGAGDELAVGEAGGDETADGVAAGVALPGAIAGAVAGADVVGAGVDGVAAAVGADVLGAAVGEVTCPDTACPECMPGVWCAEAARAMPPAADAASSPTTIEAIVSGRASRRRWRRPSCRPGRPGRPEAGRETGDGLADVTVLDGSPVSGSSMNVRVTGSGSVAGTAPVLAANSRSRAVGRWLGSLARQR